MSSMTPTAPTSRAGRDEIIGSAELRGKAGRGAAGVLSKELLLGKGGGRRLEKFYGELLGNTQPVG